MAQSAIISQQLSYTSPEGTTLIGHFSMPEGTTGVVPGIMVCPEWWGVTEHPRQQAEQLASQGYAALAIDVYGEGKVTDQASQANEWMSAMLANQDLLMQRAKAGMDILAAQPDVDASRLGAIGFCFGGKIALDMAREGFDLKGVVSFHGTLTPKQPAQPGQIKAELLIEHGEADSMVSLNDLETFRQEMDKAGAHYHVDVYPGAKHGFTNPLADERARNNSIDLGFNAQAAQQSHQAMLDFFARVFK
ncbi:dienelactone hydrolase family protein [Alkanindiges sp. WGS2144]|uniref:dienelactone hydrolase family protein n=1 Tax=Alkanindiges sp. WGS2144 TaxID=3366808 RepID=UPI0037538FE0